MAEWTGLEPATPGVTGRYSNQLNYHSSFTVRTKRTDKSQENTKVKSMTACKLAAFQNMNSFHLPRFSGLAFYNKYRKSDTNRVFLVTTFIQP